MARDLFTSPPKDLDWDDVQAFLDGGHPEDARIDYKLDMTDRVTETIAAMANTRGGVILVGVEENGNTKTPRIPSPGVTISKHKRGGTLVTYCHTRLQPVYVPQHESVEIRGQPDKAVLVIQVRSEDAPVPIWDELEGILVRIGDQNRPADLQTVAALLGREDEQKRSLLEKADEETGWLL